jgi:hypothetical protein
MAEGWKENLSAWTDMRAEPEEFRELDDGSVLLLFLSARVERQAVSKSATR